MATRFINFNIKDGSAIRINHHDYDTAILDKVFSCQRLSNRSRFTEAACKTRQSANNIATLCRVIDPHNSYWAEEYSGTLGSAWVVKTRDGFSGGDVWTVTSLGTYPSAEERRRGGYIFPVSKLADLCGYGSDATFTY